MNEQEDPTFRLGDWGEGTVEVVEDSAQNNTGLEPPKTTNNEPSKSVKKMTPEGPYTSPWATGNWYLVNTPKGIFVVQEGHQPETGIGPHSSMRDAHAWLRENGYTLKKSLGQIGKKR